MFLCSQLSDESSRKMLPLLERAIGLDPDYAQALGMKGWITMWRAFQGWEDMPYALALAEDVSRRAIAADEDEPWAYLAQAMTAYATRDNTLAMAAVRQAIALNPNFAFAHGQLGLAHAMGGRAAEALACIDHALRLSPREAFLGDYQFFYATAHFQGCSYELGLQFAREAHRLRPGHAYPLLIGLACADIWMTRKRPRAFSRISREWSTMFQGPPSRRQLPSSGAGTECALSRGSPAPVWIECLSSPREQIDCRRRAVRAASHEDLWRCVTEKTSPCLYTVSTLNGAPATIRLACHASCER